MKADYNAAEQAAKEALRTIGVLFEPGAVIEIRALDVGRTPDHAGTIHAGYFNFENSSAIASAVRSVDGRAEGVYVVLNRFNPELLARSSNRLKVRPKHTTSDADIVQWRWLYVDADPIRPAGISSTDVEHEAALQRIRTIWEFLTGCGWPVPICADSGNGGHLLYLLPPLDLKRAGSLVKRCLQALSARFSDSVVKVDESTATAARICKLYGTLARKGDSMPDRPHRRSALVADPERIVAVSPDALEVLASEITASSKPTAGVNRSLPAHGDFNIDQWLTLSGLEIIKGAEVYNGGRRWTLRACPFNTQHEKPVVIELAGGALVFKCLHKSCSEYDWKALRRHVEPDYRDSAQWPHAISSAAGSSPHVDDVSSSDEVRLITNLSQIPNVFSLQSHLDWCIEGMIAEGSITLICAESGTGKTWVGYYFAGCVAHGVPVLGHSVRACEVLYLDGENPLYVAKQRLFDLGISETPNLTVWGGWNLSPPVGPDNPLVIEFARCQKGMIIYDSLIEFHSGSEQSSTETRSFMRHFRVLANLGATVIILHHTGKAETSKQYRGSSDIKAAVDMAYLLARASEQPEELGELSMTCFKSRLAPGRNFAMEFKKGQGFVSRESKRTRSTQEIITEILKTTPNSNKSRIRQLARAQGCTRRQVDECLNTPQWGTSRGPKNSTLYIVPSEGRQDD